MPKNCRPLVSAAVLLVQSALNPALAETGAGNREAALERLVRQDCGSCHGMSLKGGLGPDLLASRLAATSPEAIAQVILDGVPGTPMPPWRPLISEADALWIANYLRGETQP